jgi:Ulp1 family protease
MTQNNENDMVLVRRGDLEAGLFAIKFLQSKKYASTSTAIPKTIKHGYDDVCSRIEKAITSPSQEHEDKFNNSFIKNEVEKSLETKVPNNQVWRTDFENVPEIPRERYEIEELYLVYRGNSFSHAFGVLATPRKNNCKAFIKLNDIVQRPQGDL